MRFCRADETCIAEHIYCGTIHKKVMPFASTERTIDPGTTLCEPLYKRNKQYSYIFRDSDGAADTLKHVVVMCLEDYPRCVKLCNKVDLTDSFPLARACAEGIATVMTSARPLRLRGGESDYYATDCAHTAPPFIF